MTEYNPNHRIDTNSVNTRQVVRRPIGEQCFDTSGDWEWVNELWLLVILCEELVQYCGVSNDYCGCYYECLVKI